MTWCTLQQFDNSGALTDVCAELLLDTLGGASATPFGVIVSGGSTPLPAYAKAAQAGRPASAHAYLIQADERLVPEDHRDSNLPPLRPLANALGITADRLLHVDTAHSLAAAAARYQSALARFIDEGGVIRLALLGMGSDGHTCSLFSPDDLARSVGRLAVAVERATPPDRVSVTPALLERAERVIFLVAGTDKTAIVRQFLENPESTVAGRAVSACRRVELWRA